MTEIAENLERIKRAAGHLNKLSDEANEVIRTVEKALLETGSGLHFESPNMGDREIMEWLGWYRYAQGKFRLMYSSSDVGSNWTPLIDARREQRIRAVQLLPDFVHKYAMHVSAHQISMEVDMAKAREANEDLSEALKRLPSSTPPKISGIEDRVRARPGD
ncbi:hypothetical protein LCGC14_0331530 [marine sediment metagenome]|uniref:Uncharacterized protein n=1 Tax=marine sediment metagenome TaxID=412755 RepID=A0A0F9TLR2_9ZZZZ